MRQPATATVKGEKKIDEFMESAPEALPLFWHFCRELLVLAALDWRGAAEFHL
jgi:hypothetical protein